MVFRTADVLISSGNFSNLLRLNPLLHSTSSFSVGCATLQQRERQIWLQKSVSGVNLVALTSSCVLWESLPNSIHPANQGQVLH